MSSVRVVSLRAKAEVQCGCGADGASPDVSNLHQIAFRRA